VLTVKRIQGGLFRSAHTLTKGGADWPGKETLPARAKTRAQNNIAPLAASRLAVIRVMISGFLPSVPLAVWVHEPHPFLIRFSETVGIRYYGLAYLLGFAAAVGLLHLYRRAGRSPFDGNMIGDLITYVIIGVLAGGRLGYFLLYQLGSAGSDPWAIFRVWEGGMASHGGMVGVGVALWLFARKHQVPFFHASDLIISTAPVGLLLGRVANFLNGELWGRPTRVPWAVIFEQTGGGTIPRHPSQLYEAALEGVVLLVLMQVRFWRSQIVRLNPGRLTGEFLAAYAVLRMIGELFREPDPGVALLLGLSRGTFYSIFLLAGGLAIMAWSARTRSQHKA
jgi:phosphatidylglycerol---prolipoprotein diacylglyceryl transferase